MLREFLAAVLLALAGCAADPEADGGLGSGGGGPYVEDLPPAREVVFRPDLDQLSREFCSTGNLTLPIPDFGDVRFEGREDRLYDGPLPCDVWNDPSSTADERDNALVSIEVTALAMAAGPLQIDRERNGGFPYLMIGQMAVYGAIAFIAPEGGWGGAGTYEVDYDAMPEEDLPGTVAWMPLTPEGQFSSKTLADAS